ncbi:MAG: thymidine kinase [Bacteroidetes bacterium]|nr:thymidine kinase [Bacteroidota bacterium]
MFLENKPHAVRSRGWIEVICGSMFYGKTEEMLRRLKRAMIARQKVEVFKPSVDTRYDETAVVSHDENIFQSTPVETASQILLMVGDDVEVVGIDEAQFFDNQLINVCNQLADTGIRVIVAGLDMDFQGKPFGPIPGLLSAAEYVDKVHAICVKCGNLAQYSHRTIKNDKLVMLGEKDNYEPLCRSCFLDEMK